MSLTSDAKNGPGSESISSAASPPATASSDAPAGREVTSSGPSDGGTAAWTRVFAAWLLFIMTWGPPLAYGAFQQYYEQDLLRDQSPSSIAWIGSINTFLLCSAGALAGPAFDKGYVKQLMTAGCILEILGYFMLSISRRYYSVMLSQGVCAGLGSGLIYVPALTFVSLSFTKHKAIAVGVTTTGASVGGVIFPVLFRRLQPQIGFGWTTRVIAFIQLGLALVALAIFYQTPKRVVKPRALFDVGAVKAWPFDAFALVIFLQFLAYWIPTFYITGFGIAKAGVPQDFAFYALSILNGASFFGRILPPLLAPRLGIVQICFGSTVAAAAVLFGWIGVDRLPGYVVFCIFWGFFSGSLVAINPTVIAHPVITPDPAQLGTRLGMQWCAAAVGILIGTPIAGQLASSGGGGGNASYVKAQVFAGCIMAGAAVCILPVWFAMRKHDRAGKVEKEKCDDV